MKKNLLFLWAFICSASLFVACSDGNGDGKSDIPDGPTAPAVIGTFRGNMDIVMTPDGSDNESVIAEGLTKNITISQVSDTEVKMELKDFELLLSGTILKLGNITIDQCVVVQNGTTFTFTGQQNLTFQDTAAALGTCVASVNGEVQNDNIVMNIYVKVPTLQQTVKVSFEGMKLTTDSGTYYDFETWVPGIEGQTPELTFYEPTGWNSSNVGAQFLKTMDYVDKYAVTQTNDAHWGKSAARIETLDSKGGNAGLTKIPKITAGALFLGAFEIDLSNTLKSAKFGIEFSKKPLSLKGYYKYTPGTDYYVCESPATCDAAIVDGTKTDEFSINVVLYTTDEYQSNNSDCLTGVDIYNSDRIVATASLTGGAQSSWQFFNMTLNYIQAFNPALKYRFAIICSSSYDGNNFNGAPGSVLVVDDFELISAE